MRIDSNHVLALLKRKPYAGLNLVCIRTELYLIDQMDTKVEEDYGPLPTRS